ncbi:uncharacterized protein LOC113795409 [Dermatophagoides pteronyssinus]|uniref:uncharacterized protein LOC113795409 n=1 Tax=Dermatophagoides pteronyssinus TaxID=6956 RepID=UPI003F676F2F
MINRFVLVRQQLFLISTTINHRWKIMMMLFHHLPSLSLSFVKRIFIQIILIIIIILSLQIPQISAVGGRGVAISSKGNRGKPIGAKPVDSDEDSGTLTVILVVILPVAQMFAVLLIIIFVRWFYRCFCSLFQSSSLCCNQCCCCSGGDQSKSKSKSKIKKDSNSTLKQPNRKNNRISDRSSSSTATTTTTIPMVRINQQQYSCYVPEPVINIDNGKNPHNNQRHQHNHQDNNDNQCSSSISSSNRSNRSRLVNNPIIIANSACMNTMPKTTNPSTNRMMMSHHHNYYSQFSQSNHHQQRSSLESTMIMNVNQNRNPNPITNYNDDDDDCKHDNHDYSITITDDNDNVSNLEEDYSDMIEIDDNDLVDRNRKSTIFNQQQQRYNPYQSTTKSTFPAQISSTTKKSSLCSIQNHHSNHSTKCLHTY